MSSTMSFAAATAAKSLQSCPTLCDPIDGSPPGSPVPGILQARTLEWDAISFSNAWKWKVKVKSLSRVRLLVTPWTAAHQAPQSMGFSRQEYWNGVPLPPPWALLGGKIYLTSEVCINLYHGHGSLGTIFTQEWTRARLSTLHTFRLKTIHWWQALYQGEKKVQASHKPEEWQ